MSVSPRDVRFAVKRAEKKEVGQRTPVDLLWLTRALAPGSMGSPSPRSRWTREVAIRLLEAHGIPTPKEWRVETKSEGVEERVSFN